jgi:HAD superfamily hydrolase (TIGR01509 family)
VLQAIIFDFDGLIVETEASIFNAAASVYERFGAELTLQTWQKVVGGRLHGFDWYDHLEQVLGHPVDRETLRAEVQKRHHSVVDTLPAQPGVVDYIDEALSRGLQLGVASSSSRGWVTRHLERLGLIQHFDAVVTSDDVTHTKPDPDLYHAALAALSVAPANAFAIEDSPNGVTAARAASLFCVAVPNEVTNGMPLGHADLRLESLADLPLSELIARFEARG